MINQPTSRTLIDCLNHYLTTCQNNCEIITVNKQGYVLLELKQGENVLHKIDGCRNIQCAYEELLDFLIDNALKTLHTNEQNKTTP